MAEVLEAKKILAAQAQQQGQGAQTAGSPTSEAIFYAKTQTGLLSDIASALHTNDGRSVADLLDHQLEILDRGFRLQNGNKDDNKKESSGSLLKDFAIGAAETFFGKELFGGIKFVSKALGKGIRGLGSRIMDLPIIGDILEDAGRVLGRAGKGLLKVGKGFLGKVMLPISLGIAVFEGFNAEEAKKLMGTDSLLGKIGSTVAHFISDFTFGILSPEEVVKLVKKMGHVGETIAKTVGDVLMAMAGKVGELVDAAFGKGTVAAIGDHFMRPVRALQSVIDSAMNWISDHTPEWAKKGLSWVKSTSERVVHAVTGGSDSSSAPQTPPPPSPAGPAPSAASDLGVVSQRFESGFGGAGTVSTGAGDAGGASYGTYQLSSKTGTLNAFLKDSGYADQFAGLIPGSPEFNAKWKSVAAADPKFGEAQHSFMRKTHYDPQVEKLKKDGVDLSGRGRGVQEAIWSTSTQFGGNTSLIEKALHGKDVSKLSDDDIINAIQDYKKDNNASLFRSSSANVQAGTLSRAEKERALLLAMDHDTSVAQAPQAGKASSGDFRTQTPVQPVQTASRGQENGSAGTPGGGSAIMPGSNIGLADLSPFPDDAALAHFNLIGS